MKNEEKAAPIESNTVIGDLIEFPVSFNFHYGKIYDARNREVATIKTIATSDDRRRLIGDFICEAMNSEYRTIT